MIEFGPQEAGVTQIIQDTYRQEGMELLRSPAWTENTNI